MLNLSSPNVFITSKIVIHCLQMLSGNHLFIISICKYVLNIYYKSGIILGVMNMEVANKLPYGLI